MREKKKHKGKRKIILDCVMAAVLLVGIGILSYPIIGEAVIKHADQRVIEKYQQEASRENNAAMKRARAKLTAENKENAEKEIRIGKDPFKKENTDDFTMSPDYISSHTIGIITIPKIYVSLPIFDITNDFFLNRGASLLEGTSFPVGGTGTRAVISAHRGLTDAKFFTDLPQMKPGDKFYIDCYGKKLAYAVEKIQTIAPDDTGALAIEKNRDLVTLMTCTPYMLNTHRLLVTGHRIPYVAAKDNGTITATAKKSNTRAVLFVIAIALAVALVILLFVRHIRALLIRGREYALTFMAGIGAVGNYRFYTRNGRKPLWHNGRELVVAVDERHMIHAEHLKGGTYRLKGDNPRLKDCIIHVKRLKDSYFTRKR